MKTWTVLAASGGLLFGVGWLVRPVEVPLWAILVLTFVPTREVTDAIKAPLQRIQREQTKDS